MYRPRLDRVAFLVLSFGGSAFGAAHGIPRDGFSLHYQADGSGKPIIFLSGGPGLEVDYMKPLADLFPSGFQRVFLEQRGTGRSRPGKLTTENMSVRLMVDDLEALRESLKLDRMILAGHSWGGVFALAYAASHPEHVDLLLLIDSGGATTEYWGWFGDNVMSRLRPEDEEALKHWREAAGSGLEPDRVAFENMKVITPAYFYDRTRGLAFSAELQAGSLHSDAMRLINADLKKNYDVRAGLRQLRRPVLIVHSHQDPIGDKTAEDLHGLMPSSLLRYIDRSGHFPWIEQPEKLRSILVEFLSQQ